jgi:hypothetical protein
VLLRALCGKKITHHREHRDTQREKLRAFCGRKLTMENKEKRNHPTDPILFRVSP